MASDARMGETPPRWRRAPDAAQDSLGMESSGMVLSRSAAAELGLAGYPEPGKLSYGMEKGCPWRGSEGCLGPVRELAGGRLGCPYPPAPPCLRDVLCRPKDGAELPPLLPPRNGQPKAGWGEPCKERPGPRWAEAVLAPLALYSHAYHRYPLPVPGLDSQRPGTAGKPRAAAGDTAGDPPAFRHCPFLVEAKHSPFLLSSLLPTGPPAESPFGGAGTEGPGAMGDGRFVGVDWRLGSYAPAWGQPLYLGVPPRCKTALTPFDDCSSSGNKEFYPKKEPAFHPSTKNHAASQLLGKSQAGQDRDGEGEPAVPELPGAPWRDGRAGGSSAVPAPHPRTPPPSAGHPLFLLQPGAGGCGGPWVGARPHGADFSTDTGPGRPSEPKDERLGYQSGQPGSPPGCGEPNPSPLGADGHHPAALAKPEHPPACLCPTPGCDGCPAVGCGVPNPFEPTLSMPGGRFPCPPSNHTKLKKTWLTRHSEQSLPRSKASRRDGGPEPPGEGKRSAKRPHGTAEGPRAAAEGAGAAKRGTKATVCPGDGAESAGDPEERRMELREGGKDARDAQRGRGEGGGSSQSQGNFASQFPAPTARAGNTCGLRNLLCWGFSRHDWVWQRFPGWVRIEMSLWGSVTPSRGWKCPFGVARNPQVGFPGVGSAAVGSGTPRGGVGISALTSAELQPYFPALLSGPVSSPRRSVPVIESQIPGMVWVGKDLKVHKIPNPAWQGHLPLAQVAPSPIRPGLGQFQSLPAGVDGVPRCPQAVLLSPEPPSRAGEPWCLQSLPCTALPQSVPRCCACAPRAGRDPEGEEEELPESTCRLMHFRRFALGDNGELSADGLCSLGEAEGELLEAAGPELGGRNVGSSLCLAKYLLGVLGDPFCDAVRRDRDAWLGTPGGAEGVTGWRRGEGAPQLCDACQRGFFNSHWSCARCGFQLCPDCHRSRRQDNGSEGPAQPPECSPGRNHHVSSLVPTQFVPTCVLTRLWKLLHEVRVKFGIESHCRCGEEAAEQSLAESPGRQEPPGAAVPTVPPRSQGPADPARPIKEESPEGGPPSPGQPPARGGTVQTTTLCDLLASTAVKLCLGQDGVRMAFAPVAPALPSDNRLTSILDSIIARVVERKIQERQAGGELSPPSPPDPPASHCVLSRSGLLWLHDPGNASNYKLFQEHWRQGQPVLVSGLQKRLEGPLWEPESFQPSREEEVEAVNLRAPGSRVRMSSREFWDGFAASTAPPEQEQSGGDLLKLESGFGDMEPSRATNLRASLPLPEYCGASGRLNLATYPRGQRGRRWLRPRVRVAYGVRPQHRNFGTKNLTVEAADSISILAHAAPAEREVLLPGDMDDLDAPLRERLRDTSGRPGALWHIFRAEDAGRIRDFLRKASEEPGQEGTVTAEPPGRYLDLALRRRLREECGVSCWSLLQFPGDAVLVPAGAPHQVQSLTGTIHVEQQFLSPESAVRLRDLGSDPPGTARQLRGQLDGMIFAAVREALGVLRGCK